MLKDYPKLSELYKLIRQVPNYPITAKQLVDFAANNNAGSSVVSFYQSFPNNLVFYDEDDLAGRSEQVEILEKERTEQPREIFTAPEED